jgi:hypothetical protein
MAFGAQRAGLAVIGNELKPPPGANGGYQAIGPARFPLILGADFVGIIEATGAGRFSPGERVFGELPITPIGSGTYAERVAVTEDAPLLPKVGYLRDVVNGELVITLINLGQYTSYGIVQIIDLDLAPHRTPSQ